MQQPQGLTLVLTGKHKSLLMALIHYSNCFMHKYNHHQQKWGSTIFITKFQTNCTHKSWEIISFLHIFYGGGSRLFLHHRKCPVYGKDMILKCHVSWLMNAICLKFVRNIIDSYFCWWHKIQVARGNGCICAWNNSICIWALLATYVEILNNLSLWSLRHLIMFNHSNWYNI